MRNVKDGLECSKMDLEILVQVQDVREGNGDVALKRWL